MNEPGFRRSVLPNGLVVLTESMPGIRSASIGVWVRAGSIHESPGEMGVSHMLEHMVFKGTGRRTARDLALVLERVGGSLDAYTTREHTSYQARVLDTDVDLALDVLADLVLTPLLRPADLDMEREVVLEEIATVEDTPDDLVFDLHADLMWRGHPYGYSILGTVDTVSSLTTDQLRRVHAERYSPGGMVVAAAGSIDHDAFVARVEAEFGRHAGRAADSPAGSVVAGGAAAATAAGLAGVTGGAPGGVTGGVTGGATGLNGNGRGAVAGAVDMTVVLPEVEPCRTCVDRRTAQTHVVWGRATFGQGDDRRIPLVLLSNAFGGGMSSRLFQRVREEMGLAYSVFSFQSFYADAGVSGVYVGTRPESADRAEAAVAEELARVATGGITADELDDVKGQVKGQIVLSLESSSARLHRLAGTELYGEPFRSMDEITALVEAVTLDEVAALAAEFFAPERQAVLRLGPGH